MKKLLLLTGALLIAAPAAVQSLQEQALCAKQAEKIFSEETKSPPFLYPNQLHQLFAGQSVSGCNQNQLTSY